MLITIIFATTICSISYYVRLNTLSTQNKSKQFFILLINNQMTRRNLFLLSMSLKYYFDIKTEILYYTVYYFSFLSLTLKQKLQSKNGFHQ